MMRLTPTEAKIYGLLRDGKPHHREEIAKFLWDELGENFKVSVRNHICAIRKQLPDGFDVATRFIRGTTHYILIQAMNPENAPNVSSN